MSKPITYDPNWQNSYNAQILTAAEAAKKIRPLPFHLSPGK